ncbi:hypothetical protein FOG51_00446 [Hanseniaspora uvarum]|jgi:hypothetical protein|uniref:Uncharacterized protein n=1 Tax=Hanseniaspora uvarum TaxID=29833 RepID=A0A1E5RD03_HANUV|nr:hypothetical protein FOG48_03123 [Hanseniaspora uvarum]KAF0274619.1 hypothetical protein FOG51_00446 [Hanseniaspora uvarum]KAF0277974.1 hypothetical protein FOG50_01188 [Hanseniaspora uvarum]OEJ84777.1 hypothetical protein AWRI3580_g3250 [Hanseniaspora uvarum]GMM41392.1 hypothetical protein DAHU10_022930 [Hanseniaspora uvarum]
MRFYKMSGFDYSVVLLAVGFSIYNSKEFFGPMIQEEIQAQTDINAGKITHAEQLELTKKARDAKVAEQVKKIKENIKEQDIE